MAVMGMENRPADSREMRAMQKYLSAAMEAGAIGVSTGLMYPPGSFAGSGGADRVDQSRLRVRRHVRYTHAKRGRPAARITGGGDPDRRGGRRARADFASQGGGKANWGKVAESLAMLDAARDSGLDIDCDVYPYTAYSTILGPLLPEVERFPETPVLISGARFDKSLVGRYAHEVAAERGQTVLECATELNQSEEGAITVVGFGMCQEDVDTVMQHPHTMIGSDGIESDSGQPHPRVYGTFARVLGEYARERGVVTLEEGVHKMTAQSAAKFRLSSRGEIAAGKFADIVVFDPKRSRMWRPMSSRVNTPPASTGC